MSSGTFDRAAHAHQSELTMHANCSSMNNFSLLPSSRLSLQRRSDFTVIWSLFPVQIISRCGINLNFTRRPFYFWSRESVILVFLSGTGSSCPWQETVHSCCCRAEAMHLHDTYHFRRFRPFWTPWTSLWGWVIKAWIYFSILFYLCMTETGIKAVKSLPDHL